MGELFPRQWRVLVQHQDEKAIEITPGSIDIEFRILRSLKPSPNRATITLWNLNEEHRVNILKRNKPTPNSAPVPIFVQVEAGYSGGQMPVLLRADMREASSVRQGTDWKTTISMDDGGNAVRCARFPNGGICFTAGTRIGTVLHQVCQALGLGLGNVADYETEAQIFGWATTLPHTMTFKGSAYDALKRLVPALGNLTFSIQAGVLQFLPKGKPWLQTAILLSPDTGLLDSPQAAMDTTVSLGFAKTASGKPSTPKPPTPKNTGILKAKAMLIPGLVPGRIVRLESAMYKGNYEISEVEYQGQSWGTEWSATMVLRSYVT